MTDSTSTPDEANLPHVVYDPPPASAAEVRRQQRTLRRVTRLRKAPAWVRKISWVLFPFYGLMRLHDPDYEEHYEQYEERQRQDYGRR